MALKSQWVDWLKQDVTQEFLRELHFRREEFKEGLAEGESAENSFQYGVSVGRCQAHKDILEGVKVGFGLIVDGGDDDDQA